MELSEYPEHKVVKGCGCTITIDKLAIAIEECKEHFKKWMVVKV